MQSVSSLSRPAEGRREALVRLPMWVRLLYVLGGVLAITAALVVYVAVRVAQQGEPVLVTARELPAGQTITAADLRIADDGRLPSSTRPIVIPASQGPLLIGQFASRRLPAGAPLVQGDITRIPPLRPGFAEVTVPITPSTSPPLAPGMRVAVIELAAGSDTRAPRTPLVRGAIVQQVLVNGGTVGGAETGTAAVALTRTVTATLLVEEAAAPAVAAVASRVALAVLPDEPEGAR